METGTERSWDITRQRGKKEEREEGKEGGKSFLAMENSMFIIIETTINHVYNTSPIVMYIHLTLDNNSPKAKAFHFLIGSSELIVIWIKCISFIRLSSSSAEDET